MRKIMVAGILIVSLLLLILSPSTASSPFRSPQSKVPDAGRINRKSLPASIRNRNAIIQAAGEFSRKDLKRHNTLDEKEKSQVVAKTKTAPSKITVHKSAKLTGQVKAESKPTKVKILTRIRQVVTRKNTQSVKTASAPRNTTVKAQASRQRRHVNLRTQQRSSSNQPQQQTVTPGITWSITLPFVGQGCSGQVNIVGVVPLQSQQ